MNLSGIRSTARRMCSAPSQPAPRRGRPAQQACAAGELEDEPLVGILEIHVQQLGDSADPVGHGGRRPEPGRPQRPGGRLPPIVVSGSSGGRFSLGLIHPCPEPLTSERRVPVRQGQVCSRPTVDGAAQSSKAGEGQPLRGFKSHLHRPYGSPWCASSARHGASVRAPSA
jgi:hypothetical protein